MGVQATSATFDDFEFVNLAYQPEHAALASRHAALLKAQFDKAEAKLGH